MSSRPSAMKRLLRSLILLAAVNHLALAQTLDWAAIEKIPAPTYSTDAAVTATTVLYTPSAAAASVAAAIVGGSAAKKRSSELLFDKSFEKRTAGLCEALPAGDGPTPSPDTPEAFLADTDFSSAALSAPVPAGYTQTYSNLNASSNAYGFMGYQALSTYDSDYCASLCSAIEGCMAINIYFERDPSVEPGTNQPNCPNPPSTTTIKCVFWGGPVTPDNAVNYGQTRNEFVVVQAGSNGYVNSSIEACPGYSQPEYLGDAAINAPWDSDCNGTWDTYMGYQAFTGLPFDVGLCEAACAATSQYNRDRAAESGLQTVRTCQFFNTYILAENGVPLAQYCAMYTRAWDSTYATNTGQSRGNDSYTIEYSYSYYNLTQYLPYCPPASSSSSSSSIVSSTTSSSSSSSTPASPVLPSTTSSSSSGLSSSSPAPSVISSTTSLSSSYSSSSSSTPVSSVPVSSVPASSVPASSVPPSTTSSSSISSVTTPVSPVLPSTTTTSSSSKSSSSSSSTPVSSVLPSTTTTSTPASPVLPSTTPTTTSSSSIKSSSTTPSTMSSKASSTSSSSSSKSSSVSSTKCSTTTTSTSSTKTSTSSSTKCTSTSTSSSKVSSTSSTSTKTTLCTTTKASTTTSSSTKKCTTTTTKK